MKIGEVKIDEKISVETCLTFMGKIWPTTVIVKEMERHVIIGW